MEKTVIPDFQHWLCQWPDGLIALNNEGSVSWVSEKAFARLGWGKEALGKNIHDLLCIQSRGFEHERCDCQLLREDAESATTNSICWLRSDGEYISVDYRKLGISNPPLVASLISFVENTDSQYNFAELTKFSSFVDKNPAAIAEFDKHGQILFGNPSMQELLLNYSFDEDGVANILPANFAEICSLCCDQRKSITHVDVKVGDCWYSWHFHPLDNNNELSAIGYAFDATQQKHAEQQAGVTRAEARRDFYAKMMHELRTPLNAIVGYSDLVMLRSEENLSERDKSALRGIKIGGMQLNELITDTLDISKIEAGKMTADIEEFNVRSVLDEIYEQMHYLADVKKLNYSVICDDTVNVLCDRRKVRQILVNLTSNAIKYTKAGSVIVTVCEMDEQNGVSEFELVVSDTGVGIPEEQLDDLFQAYKQVRESKNKGIQGTGLGLALVKELVAVLNGTISLDSVYGEGSTFTVRLPVSPDFKGR